MKNIFSKFYIIILMIFVMTNNISTAAAYNESSHQINCVSDNQVQDFLNNFIAQSVKTVQMLFDFVSQMVKGGMKDDGSGPFPNKLPNQ